MEINWSQESLERLIEIEDYIAQDNPLRAMTFVNELIECAMKLLANQPRIGRIVSEFNNAKIRELIFRNYRIVYRLTTRKIEILTVFEGHRQFPDSRNDP